MKTNRVRQATNTETPGLLPRIMKVIADNRNTATAYGLWTFGTGLAVTLALRGQSKGEKYSKVISQGTLSALGTHFTATGLGVRDALSSTENVGTEEPPIYSPGDDVIRLINSATIRINSFLASSFCSTNASAYSVFGLCGACGVSDPTAEICGNCQGITLKLLNKEVEPKFGKNNFIWGNKDFYNNIIKADDEELWKIIYNPDFSQLWDELKPNPDTVWNYSNNRLTLKADGVGFNFCDSEIPP